MNVDVVNEAELAVLASVLVTGGACLDDLALTEADFRDGTRGGLFEAMQAMHAEGKPVEAYTLSESAQPCAPVCGVEGAPHGSSGAGAVERAPEPPTRATVTVWKRKSTPNASAVTSHA